MWCARYSALHMCPRAPLHSWGSWTWRDSVTGFSGLCTLPPQPSFPHAHKKCAQTQNYSHPWSPGRDAHGHDKQFLVPTLHVGTMETQLSLVLGPSAAGTQLHHSPSPRRPQYKCLFKYLSHTQAPLRAHDGAEVFSSPPFILSTNIYWVPSVCQTVGTQQGANMELTCQRWTQVLFSLRVTEICV